MFDFQKLEVYKKAKQLHLDCKELIKKCDDKYVIDQLSRASYSIPLNIAEGSGKFSAADRKNYFTPARASVFECVAIIEILEGEGKVKTAEYANLMDSCEQLSKMLFRMIMNLRK